MSANNPWGRGAGLPDLGPPKQLLMEPGDAVFCHPMLAHRGCPNFSPDVRYMVRFVLFLESPVPPSISFRLMLTLCRYTFV